MTHPFHPLLGRQFDVVTLRRNWGEDRVYYHDEEGRLCSIPTSWTSLAMPDPFIEAADGRTHFRFEDLLRLTEWLQPPAGERS